MTIKMDTAELNRLVKLEECEDTGCLYHGWNNVVFKMGECTCKLKNVRISEGGKRVHRVPLKKEKGEEEGKES